jgi:hypothetical protein
MSLNIPSAPNAGLFKQGYQKYVVLSSKYKASTDHPKATTLRMELFFAILMLAVPSPLLFKHP